MNKLLYGILQFIELVKYGQIHFFLIFFLWSWLIWLIKIAYSRRYRNKYNEDYNISVAVVIPTYNEDPKLFNDALESTIREKPNEIIIVFDGPNPILEEIAKSYPNTNINIITIPKSGKRKAFAAGVTRAKSEIIVMKDSDSLFTPGSLKELIKPFVDPSVGGVTPNIHIFNPNQSCIRRLTEWMYNLRSSIIAPAQSVCGTISVLTGPAAAYRKKLILPYLDEFLNEKFLGIRCETGDDRSLTNFILKSGFKTVFQKKSVVYTDSQNTLRQFWRQQLRWSRSSQRYTLMSLSWMFKKPKFFAFHLLSEFITPFFFLAVIINAVLNFIFHFDKFILLEGTFLGNLWFGLILMGVGMNFSLGIRQIPHFFKKPIDIFWLPIHVFITIIVLLPVKILGFFTMGNQGWMTRESNNQNDGAIKIIMEGVEAK